VHRSRLAQIVIDCEGTDVEQAAQFWGAALGRPVSKPEDPADAHYRELGTGDEELNMLVQSVDHASRVHLDIETDDVEAEVERLESLGARRVRQVRSWWVMEAPTGQRFCVLAPQTDSLPLYGNVWE
jgi:predicted enzyme related to lactoylglutathione lyase